MLIYSKKFNSLVEINIPSIFHASYLPVFFMSISKKTILHCRLPEKRGDKFSQCILGHFIARGIGTKRNSQEGVRMMLESGIEDYYRLAATDIGLYFLELSKKEDQNKKNSAKPTR